MTNRRIEVVNRKTFLPTFFVTSGNQVALDTVERACSRIDSTVDDCRFWWNDVEVLLADLTNREAVVRVKSDNRLLSDA